MGILNLTPDSFSDGGVYADPDAALRRAEEMAAQGANLLDLGAESTRPGAQPVPAQVQRQRLQPVLAALSRARLPVALSVDTNDPEVACAAADAGAAVLNLTFPWRLCQLPGGPPRWLARFDGIVIMHARGTPATMTQADLCTYGPDLVREVAAELQEVASALLPDPALRARVLFDPGLGFAKTAAQSLALLGQIAPLCAALGRPLLCGASRKSFLGQATGLPVGERLIPSVTAAALCAAGGAAAVRVHDVAATRQALQVVAAAKAHAHAHGHLLGAGGADAR
jgi:dihydropteroate synthase